MGADTPQSPRRPGKHSALKPWAISSRGTSKHCQLLDARQSCWAGDRRDDTWAVAVDARRAVRAVERRPRGWAAPAGRGRRTGGRPAGSGPALLGERSARDAGALCRPGRGVGSPRRVLVRPGGVRRRRRRGRRAGGGLGLGTPTTSAARPGGAVSAPPRSLTCAGGTPGRAGRSARASPRRGTGRGFLHIPPKRCSKLFL